MSSLPHQVQLGFPGGHMIVCGDDTLAHRLAGELRDVYDEQVVLVVPPLRASHLPPAPAGGRGR
ncbi:hypothetical protein, partial [Streptomyces sp. 150FB]|uniref:hypothetical protein n=1 Tax=Streptomyces sp. 150FB TaxID=1576605 RepID=UPI001237469A